jgi:hypothetical protein
VTIYFVAPQNRIVLRRTTTTARTKEIRELGENFGNDVDCRKSVERSYEKSLKIINQRTHMSLVKNLGGREGIKKNFLENFSSDS